MAQKKRPDALNTTQKKLRKDIGLTFCDFGSKTVKKSPIFVNGSRSQSISAAASYYA